MNSETFNCDVCAEPIAIQDTTAHIITHQTQLLNLVNRLPRNNISLINNQDTDTPTERGQNQSRNNISLINQQDTDTPTERGQNPSRNNISLINQQDTDTPTERGQNQSRNNISLINQQDTDTPTERGQNPSLQCPECQHTPRNRSQDLIRHYATHYRHKATCRDCQTTFGNYASVFLSHRCFKKPKKPSNALKKDRADLKQKIDDYLKQNYNLQSRGTRRITPTNDSISLQIRQETHPETLYDGPVGTDGISSEQSLPEAPGRHTQSTLPTGLPFQQLSQSESGPCDGYIESYFQAGRVAHHILPPHDIPMEMQFPALESSSGLYGQSCQSLEERFRGGYMGQDGNENGI